MQIMAKYNRLSETAGIYIVLILTGGGSRIPHRGRQPSRRRCQPYILPNIFKIAKKLTTRMHSSRVRTGRSLTVCWRLLPGGGVCLGWGGLPGPGGPWSRGVSAWSRGVSAWSGGVSAWSRGGSPWRGGSPYWRPPCEQNDRQV